MKLWEVLNGINDGNYKFGDTFNVSYPNAPDCYAQIGMDGNLYWLHADGTSYIVRTENYNEGNFKFINNLADEIKDEILFDNAVKKYMQDNQVSKEVAIENTIEKLESDSIY